MPVKKQAKQKHEYQILVTRYQTYRFNVEAESAEKACSVLHRSLRSDELTETECQEKPVFSTWSNPSQPQEQWLVMRTTPIAEGDKLLLSEWNGKQITGIAEAKKGEDIVSALRHVVDPRPKNSKLKKKA